MVQVAEPYIANPSIITPTLNLDLPLPAATTAPPLSPLLGPFFSRLYRPNSNNTTIARYALAEPYKANPSIITPTLNLDLPLPTYPSAFCASIVRQSKPIAYSCSIVR